MADVSASPTYVITLVHGTWADTRGWVAPGSFLRTELERQLGSVVFRAFPWISAYTHAARAEAGARLAKFIRGGHALYPQARHVIIGHSHGGMVALYAMRDPDADRAVERIVTLATPFVRARRRRFRPYVGVISFLLVAVATVSGALALTAPSLARVRLAWMGAGTAVLIAADARLSKWVIGFCRRRQTEAMAALLPPSVDPSRLLILCPRLDEARWWLHTWDVAANAPFVIAGVVLSLLGGVAWSLTAQSFHRDDPISMLGVAVMLTLTVLVLSGLVRSPGYGRDWAWVHPLVAIRSGRTPGNEGGPHTAHAIETPPLHHSTQRFWRRLRHNAIHEAPAVALAVKAWLERNSRCCRSPNLTQLPRKSCASKDRRDAGFV